MVKFGDATTAVEQLGELDLDFTPLAARCVVLAIAGEAAARSGRLVEARELEEQVQRLRAQGIKGGAETTRELEILGRISRSESWSRKHGSEWGDMLGALERSADASREYLALGFLQRRNEWMHERVLELLGREIFGPKKLAESVSYTHLTLPTIYSV